MCYFMTLRSTSFKLGISVYLDKEKLPQWQIKDFQSLYFANSKLKQFTLRTCQTNCIHPNKGVLLNDLLPRQGSKTATLFIVQL